MTYSFQLDKDIKKVMRHSAVPVFLVDAFTCGPFSGNPAAVSILPEPLPVEVMQKIAAEYNQPAMAFLMPREDGSFQIRWFTPKNEIQLCGHATMASAHVLFCEFEHDSDAILLRTLYHGNLKVFNKEGKIQLDFPALPSDEVPVRHEYRAQFPSVFKAFRGDRLVLLLEDEEELKKYQPDIEQLMAMNEFAVGISALSSDPDLDIISRFFSPHIGLVEDPVTGSLHCHLMPIWAEVHGKKELRAFQASSRSGFMSLKLDNKRVWITGQAHTFSKGEIVNTGVIY